LKGFLAGALTGGVLVALAVQFGAQGGSSAPLRAEAQGRGLPFTPNPVAPGTHPQESPDRAPANQDAAFEPGLAVLRIGEGYRFGEGHAVAGADAADVDILCLDICGFVSFRCPRGCGQALLPLLYSGGTPSRETAWQCVTDAPEALAATEQFLNGSSVHYGATGILLVRTRDGGATFKLQLVAVNSAPLALERSIQIRYARVPERVGGGLVQVSAAADCVPASADENERLVSLFDAPERFDDHLRSLPRTFLRVGDLPRDFTIARGGAFVVDAPLASRLVLASSDGALVLRGGIGPGGHLVVQSGAVVVEGELAGHVEVHLAFLRVLGKVTGSVELRGSPRLILDEDVWGKIHYDGIPSILARGQFIDPANNLEGSGIPTVYLDGFLTGAELLAFRGIDGITHLELRDSDLTVGDHGRVGEWQHVKVGSRIWEKLAPER